MLRACVTLSCVLWGSVGFAGPAAELSSPRETVQISANAGDLLAYFERAGNEFDVTLLFTDRDGDVLRSRISLEDDQRHSVTLSDHDNLTRSTYALHRKDERIEVSVQEFDDPQQVAKR